MRMTFLITLTMTAFAANSLLNRVAVDGGHADPGSFAAIRVAAGALVLLALARAQGRRLPAVSLRRAIGAGTLALYMIGFSLAYLSLDAGLGALILFGVVQITMFAVSTLTGDRPTPRRAIGAAVAFGGLVVVMGPSALAGGGSLFGALAMIAAGVGWGLYTLAGRGEPDATAATAANFLYALPLVLIALLLNLEGVQLTVAGVVFAVISGAVTSGMGYALWYSLLPRIEPSFAAVIQLSVPVIAVAGGVGLLGETVGWRFGLGAVLVLGGIGFALWPARRA